MTDELEIRLADAARALEPSPLDADELLSRAEDERLLDVAYTTEETAVGELLLAATPRGIVRIAFLDHGDRDRLLEQLSERVSPRVLSARKPLDTTLRELDDYLEGRRKGFDMPLDWALVGPFGRRVLERTARIPYGEVSTYGEVASSIGSPRAARATGNALARNPIVIVVPCHRVVPGSGGVGGYGGGPDRKRFLLALEGRG